MTASPTSSTGLTSTGPTPGRWANSEIASGKFNTPLHLAITAGSVIAGSGITMLFGRFRWGWASILATMLYIGSIYTVSRAIEDRRRATDRLAAAVMTSSFVLVIIPLLSVTWTVVGEGLARLDATFFTDTMRLTPDALAAQRNGQAVGGGIHAVYGTLIVTGLAAVISVPLGLFAAIYLVEYGRGRLARAITSMVDVMTGIPSIVAGLFAYSLFVLCFGPGTRSGVAGSVALAVLMTPVVVRSTEEMLRLVPNELREAAFALGVPRWKTVVKVVIPTAIAGILTGVTLAVARVIGETAPLLVTAGLAQGTNIDPFSDRMTTLPVYTYMSYKFPTLPPEASIDRAWTAALVLVIMVGIMFTVARLLAKFLKPKGH